MDSGRGTYACRERQESRRQRRERERDCWQVLGTMYTKAKCQKSNYYAACHTNVANAPKRPHTAGNKHTHIQGHTLSLSQTTPVKIPCTVQSCKQKTTYPCLKIPKAGKAVLQKNAHTKQMRSLCELFFIYVLLSGTQGGWSAQHKDDKRNPRDGYTYMLIHGAIFFAFLLVCPPEAILRHRKRRRHMRCSMSERRVKESREEERSWRRDMRHDMKSAAGIQTIVCPAPPPTCFSCAFSISLETFSLL